MFSPLEWVLIGAAVLAGAALQGSIGYGYGLIATPLLVLIDPRLIPGPLMLGSVVLCGLTLVRERQAIDLKELRWALVGAIPGTAAGAALIAYLPPAWVGVALGVFILAAVVMSLLGNRLPHRSPHLLAAGTVAGMMSTAAAVGGPPLALVYQDSPGARLRTTMAAYFGFTGLLSMGMLHFFGRFGTQEAWLGLGLVPGTLIGLYVSSWLVRLLNQRFTHASVLLVATLSAFIVIFQNLR